MISCSQTSSSVKGLESVSPKNSPADERTTDEGFSSESKNVDSSTVSNLEDLGEWNPQVEGKDCRENQQQIFSPDGFTHCLSGLDEMEAQLYLKRAFWPDSLWIKTLETRKAAWLHLKKNRKHQEAKAMMEQMLKLFAQIDLYKQEVLSWLEAESQAENGRLELWQDKFHELENSLRVGNSKTQLEARIEGWDRSVLDAAGLQRLDEIFEKAGSIDSLRVVQKWELWINSEEESERELAKQVLLEKYQYLLTNSQLNSLQKGVNPEDDTEAQCEQKRSQAADYLANSKKNPSRKREYLSKAAGELSSCLELLPEGDYRDKVESELRKIKRWM